jgi:hypothetical protein
MTSMLDLGPMERPEENREDRVRYATPLPDHLHH